MIKASMPGDNHAQRMPELNLTACTAADTVGLMQIGGLKFLSSNSDSSGTGLGLPIARGAAELHGGRLTLANRPIGGLEATLTLPRMPPSDTAKKQSMSASPS